MNNKKRDTQQLRDKMRWIQLFFAEERTEEEEKEMKSIEYKYGDRPMQKEDFDRMRESTKQHIAI